MPNVITPEMVGMLKAAGDPSPAVALPARAMLAKALTLPLRQGVLDGDNTSGIFQEVDFAPGVSVEFPLDFITPSNTRDIVAYTIPNQGRLPTKHFEGDMVLVPTYEVGNSIGVPLKYVRDARWDIVARVMQALEAGHVLKNNRDAWRTILAAAKGRGLAVYDDQATAGLFTKRLIALAETVMRRNAGGNSSSVNRGMLTDVFMSPEAHQDVLTWDLTQIPDSVRSQIYMNWDAKGVTRIGRVNLHDIDEFGVGQEYEAYYENTLGGSLPGSKLEIMVGLDLSKDDCFIRPVREKVTMYEDQTAHAARRMSLYSFGEGGWTVLDSRRALLLAA
jgi:hypothetical protein